MEFFTTEYFYFKKKCSISLASLVNIHLQINCKFSSAFTKMCFSTKKKFLKSLFMHGKLSTLGCIVRQQLRLPWSPPVQSQLCTFGATAEGWTAYYTSHVASSLALPIQNSVDSLPTGQDSWRSLKRLPYLHHLQGRKHHCPGFLLLLSVSLSIFLLAGTEKNKED